MQKIYVAHPYGGKEENKLLVENLIKCMTIKNPNVLYVSPIHALGFLYTVVSYARAMYYCFGLLEDCNILLLCDGWETSNGCILEKAYADTHDIPIIYYNKGEYLNA